MLMEQARQLVAGLIWKARTMSLRMVPEQVTRLYIPVNARDKFSPPLPAAYMGNGIVMAAAIATSAELSERPVHYAVQLVQEAIASITDKYVSCMNHHIAYHA